MKPRLLSGIQSSGLPHIGNYFGAMKQFVDLQDRYECFVMVADYHALTTIKDAEELRGNIFEVVMDYLAIGLDPEKVSLFKQSDVSEHTELAWIFECLVTVPFLMQAHAYKDKVAKGLEANAGLFNYPMLMAADILLYSPDVVPVGEDQRQHIEYAREAAAKFNHAFGETFKEPHELIVEGVGTVPGTDGRKMSKSYKNTIPLFADDATLRSAVMSIQTDSKGVEEPKDPEACNVFAIHKLVSGGPELAEIRDRYEAGGIGYKESKDILFKNLSTFIAPLRERRTTLEKDPGFVLDVLREGGKRAKEVAAAKMEEVRKRVGVGL
jgi:tryptophanyl-tRNA synthetase